MWGCPEGCGGVLGDMRMSWGMWGCPGGCGDVHSNGGCPRDAGASLNLAEGGKQILGACHHPEEDGGGDIVGGPQCSPLFLSVFQACR